MYIYIYIHTCIYITCIYSYRALSSALKPWRSEALSPALKPSPHGALPSSHWHHNIRRPEGDLCKTNLRVQFRL